MLPYPITTNALIWDSWNVQHIARHEVTQPEVEEVCDSRFLVLQGYDGRYVIVGHTFAGRLVSVVIEPEDEERYYVVTARSASHRERRTYREEI